MRINSHVPRIWLGEGAQASDERILKPTATKKRRRELKDVIMYSLSLFLQSCCLLCRTLDIVETPKVIGIRDTHMRYMKVRITKRFLVESRHGRDRHILIVIKGTWAYACMLAQSALANGYRASAVA